MLEAATEPAFTMYSSILLAKTSNRFNAVQHSLQYSYTLRKHTPKATWQRETTKHILL
jgi:hypothetical protein